MTLETGQRLGPYTLVKVLGAGGMGAVFRARHDDLNREVALKVLRPDTQVSPELLRRFDREARLASKMSHPNLVEVLDAGTVDGVSYLAMELVEGMDLDHVLEARGAIDWPIAMAIGRCVLSGLGHLHGQNVVHRDIKPSNVLLGQDGVVKVADFGLARFKEQTILTAPGTVIGTIRYLAPEILRGKEASPASDLWAAGAMLYLALSGRSHVDAGSPTALMTAILSDPIGDLGTLVPALPGEVAAVVMGLLDRDPTVRPSRAAMVCRTMEQIIADETGLTWERALGEGALANLMGLGGTPPVRPPMSGDSRKTAGRLRVRVSGPVHRPPGSSGKSTSLSSLVALAADGSAASSRRRLRGGVALGLGLAALIVFGFPGRPGPTDPSSETTVISSTAPADSGATSSPATTSASEAVPVPRSFLNSWRLVEPRRHDLVAGGDGARRAAIELTRASGLDLGQPTWTWLAWESIGRWTVDPRRGPAPAVHPEAVRGALPPIELAVMRQAMTMHRHRHSSGMVASTLRVLAGYPDDWRAWMVLAFLYDAEGDSPSALVAESRGLSLLGSAPVDEENSLLLGRLCVAFANAGPTVLEERFWPMATSCPGIEDAVSALITEVGPSDPERVERVLRKGLRTGRQFATDSRESARDAAAAVGLSTHITIHSPRPDEARVLLGEALLRNPANKQLIEATVRHHMVRGRFTEARAAAAHYRKVSWRHVTIDYLEGPAPRKPAHAGSGIGARDKGLARLEGTRLIEIGDLDGAAAWIEECKDTRGRRASEDVRLVMAELMGAGKAAPWMEEEVLDELLSGDASNLGEWAQFVGAMASNKGEPHFERAVSKTVGRSVPENLLGALRALWLSRRGQHGPSAETLKRALAHRSPATPSPPAPLARSQVRSLWRDRVRTQGGIPVDWVSEIALRPAVDRLLDRKPPGPLLSVARDLAVLPAASATAAVTDALNSGKVAEAAALVEELWDQRPSAPLWPLLGVALAHARSDLPARARWLTRARAGQRFSGRNLWCLRLLAQKFPESPGNPAGAPVQAGGPPGR